mgnify:CR=1 FL=1|tara:strand:+ start:4573 stop:6465 length:1893 start_codon:yes stop_codon:yes gene_type:complete
MAALINELTQYVGTNGKPFVGGSLFIGTVDLDPELNPITIYSDRELTVAISNPQTLDSYGRSANKIWIPGKYSLKVEDVDSVQVLQELDNGSVENVGNSILTDILGADTITANGVNTLTSYVDGQTYIFTAGSNNTGPVTLNIDGLGAKAIQKNFTSALVADDLVATYEIVVVYNSDNDIFQLVNVLAAAQTLPEDYYRDGVITRSVSDTQNFDVTAGIARDSTNAQDMTLLALSKEANAAWVVGTGNGALLTGSIVANSAYNIYAMLRTDLTSVDYGIDLVANGITNIPALYTLSRKIGRLFTDVDSNILPTIINDNGAPLPEGHSSGGVMSIGLGTLAVATVSNVGSDASFNFTPGPTFVVGDNQITLSGFTEPTYNVTEGTVTTTGAGLIQVNDIAFVATDAGTISYRDYNLIAVTDGVARDDLNTADMIGAAMQKDISATWAVGDGNGGLFSGTVAADTTYYYFAIRRDTDGVIDYGFDTSIIAANIPTGYTAYKFLSSLTTDTSSVLVDSVQGKFRSGNFSFTTGTTLLEFLHGFDALPGLNKFTVVITNMTANQGYVAGQKIVWNNTISDTAAPGQAFNATDLQFDVRMGNSATNRYSLLLNPSGSLQLGANASWDIEFFLEFS